MHIVFIDNASLTPSSIVQDWHLLALCEIILSNIIQGCSLALYKITPFNIVWACPSASYKIISSSAITIIYDFHKKYKVFL